MRVPQALRRWRGNGVKNLPGSETAPVVSPRFNDEAEREEAACTS
jgi:hypothetical protein